MIDKALAALRSVGVSEFDFHWQRDEYLLTLGQALLRTDDPDGALAQFLLVEGKASPLTAAAAQNYARMIQEKRAAAKRTEIREQVARVKTLLESGEDNTSPSDDWTSRPLVLCILPCRPGSSQTAADSGLADLFPWMLGQTLPAKAPVTLVDRELVSEVLMEQELSASLGSDAGRLRLGKVLGARILMDCSFIALMGKEYLVPRLVDTESTASIPMEKVVLSPGTDPDVWTGEVADKAAAAMAAAYPVRGRLEAGDGGFTANIGAKVGVKPGMRFLLLDGPDPAAVRPGCIAVAGPGVTDDSCPATIEGCPADAAPEGGFYIMAEGMPGNV
ncbi:MAG TPA: hypothetical protein P5069_18450 [Candidatus Hydrogenedentes bacterium]|nr:hypothetical protein [Candidatus Hydrogenedentota bacterium]